MQSNSSPSLFNKRNSEVRKSFDVTKYQIIYNSVFESEEVKQSFHKHLKEEFNDEQFEFLLEVQKFKKEVEKEQKLKLFFHILETFIFDGSKCELNLSGKTKTDILSKIGPQLTVKNDWVIKNEETIFDSLYESIYFILNADSFPRFVRTDSAQKIILKKHSDRGICCLKITTQFPHGNDHFYHPYIEDLDWEYSKQIIKDNNDWELVGSKVDDHLNSFVSFVNYFPNVTLAPGNVSLKYECVLPFTLDRCLLGYLTNTTLKKADPNTTFIETQEYISADQILKHYCQNGKEDLISSVQTDLTVNNAHISLGTPFFPRFFKYGGSVHYDEKEKLFISLLKSYFPVGTKLVKPVNSKMVMKNGKISSKNAYPLFEFMITAYKEIEEKKVLFTQINCIDAFGWTHNPLVVKLLAKTRGLELRNTLVSQASQIPEDTKIEDCKEELCKEEDGNPVNGLGKLLYEMRMNQLKTK
jgi:hypothetical protein